MNKLTRYTTLLFALILCTNYALAHEIEPKLINPQATKEAVALYDYLREIYGKKTLSAAMCKYTIESTEADWIHRKTGKYPAILCYDMMNVTLDKSHDDYSDMVKSAKRWSSKGGIVAVMWHWRDPFKQSDAFYSMNMKNTPKARTTFDVSRINDPTSREYKAMVEDIDVMAKYLLELQALNIPVLWRPLHEAQGGWFWWGAGSGEDCKALWSVMYERLTHHHGLNNLIWIWTVDDVESRGRGRAEEWYPGDDMVDILGTDIYGEPSHDSQRAMFDFTATIGSHRKMVALTECGSIPHPDNMIAGGDKWLWFMPWVAEFMHDEKYLTVEMLKDIFAHDFVVTRDEVQIKK